MAPVQKFMEKPLLLQHRRDIPMAASLTDAGAPTHSHAASASRACSR